MGPWVLVSGALPPLPPQTLPQWEQEIQDCSLIWEEKAGLDLGALEMQRVGGVQAVHTGLTGSRGLSPTFQLSPPPSSMPCELRPNSLQSWALCCQPTAGPPQPPETLGLSPSAQGYSPEEALLGLVFSSTPALCHLPPQLSLPPFYSTGLATGALQPFVFISWILFLGPCKVDLCVGG